MVEENRAKSLSTVNELLLKHQLPLWEQLPDLDIYMDQVLTLLSRYLHDYPGYVEKSMTSAMVNNYVKQGIIPAPVKKKYNRQHLAFLIILYILKTSITIDEIGKLFYNEKEKGRSAEEIYKRFQAQYQDSMTHAAQFVTEIGNQDMASAVMNAALDAQAQQLLTNMLSDLLVSAKKNTGRTKRRE